MRPPPRTVSINRGSATTAEPRSSRRPKAPNRGPRALVIDIETAPIAGYVWKIWEENVGLDQIIQDCTILSYAAKWIDSDKVIFNSVAGQGAENLHAPGTGIRNDRPLMAPLRALLNEAQVVITQNGQAFDTKRINARMVVHGFLPPSKYRILDTKLIAKRSFAFTSNKLEWMSKILTDEPKHKHGKFPGFELWAECMKDNPLAWKEMRTYNIQDVIACEQVWRKLRAWDPSHINWSTYDWDAVMGCRVCGSQAVELDGYQTLQVGVYAQYRCLEPDCGAWSRGRKMLTPKETRDAKLV